MTIEEQIATELIERTKRNESAHYAGRIEGDGWWFAVSAVVYDNDIIPVWYECSDNTVMFDEIRQIYRAKCNNDNGIIV